VYAPSGVTMRDICGGRVSKVTLVDPGLTPVVGVIAPQLKTPRKAKVVH
jgi:hypothetical protein